jgi:type II secretion system protein H
VRPAAGNRRPSPVLLPGSIRARGFTLLELLAVITIIAVLSGLVVPLLGSNADRDASSAAQRLAQLINQAREESVMSSRIWQIRIDPLEQHYRFLQLAGNEFVEVSMPPFAGEHGLDQARLGSLEINGEPVPDVAELYLFPTGEQDAFRLVLRGDDNEYVIAMGPVGEAGLVEL